MILFFIYCVDWNTANVYIKKLYIVIECLFYIIISCEKYIYVS